MIRVCKARDLKVGMKTSWYTVLTNASVSATGASARVRYNDLGEGVREWPDPDTMIEIQEEVPDDVVE
jgi:hypothetical protein